MLPGGQKGVLYGSSDDPRIANDPHIGPQMIPKKKLRMAWRVEWSG